MKLFKPLFLLIASFMFLYGYGKIWNPDIFTFIQTPNLPTDHLEAYLILRPTALDKLLGVSAILFGSVALFIYQFLNKKT